MFPALPKSFFPPTAKFCPTVGPVNVYKSMCFVCDSIAETCGWQVYSLYVVYRLRTLHLTTSLRSALGYDRTRMNYRRVLCVRGGGRVL